MRAIKSTGRQGGGNPQRKPGPKVGSRHSGMFKKGHDPRRGNGRPKKTSEMRDLERLCRQSASDALDFLLDTIGDTEAPRNVRLQAAREILDRGFGKPVDRQAVLSISAGDAPEQLSRSELLKIAAGAYEGGEDAQVIEMPTKNGD